ncbi:small ribosomal subunit protein uS15m [Drosophila sulfurigaster albostrigata]|uniref:small ribosomal subunit protein uS15m n=1 Tax=Drosophila sulfurigaster albostrigata TaxID=89887 RepID=UPI002D218581|nr:small ribosomal subunit protein uS15m [Drosophila sulfurigaster albostrigata]
MNKLLNIAQAVPRQFVRDYAFKSDLKIKWVRPEKIASIRPEKSGDLAKPPPLNANEILPEYKDSKELQNADETVKSLFKLNNNRNHLTTRYYRDQMVREVQRHAQDFGSMEARLAKMTAFIRRYQEHMEQSPRDRVIKVRLKELIEKRKKFLKYLRRWDYPRFEWILEKLDLVYKPPPTHFHWITRKESLQKLTDIYCDNIKEERLEAYHKELQAQQIPYLEEAIKKMVFVRQEQIDCDVPVTVTEQQIDEARKELAKLKEVRDAEAAVTRKQSDDTFH